MKELKVAVNKIKKIIDETTYLCELKELEGLMEAMKVYAGQRRLELMSKELNK